jgi:hypothetical protein
LSIPSKRELNKLRVWLTEYAVANAPYTQEGQELILDIATWLVAHVPPEIVRVANRLREDTITDRADWTLYGEHEVNKE